MRTTCPINVIATFAVAIVAAGCQPEGGARDMEQARSESTTRTADAGAVKRASEKRSKPPEQLVGRWDLASSGEGDGLQFFTANEELGINFFCERTSTRLLVTIRRFHDEAHHVPVEIAGNGHSAKLRVKPDASREGVSAEAPLPANLSVILSAGVTLTYGGQKAIVKAPDTALVQRFVKACADVTSAN